MSDRREARARACVGRTPRAGAAGVHADGVPRTTARIRCGAEAGGDAGGRAPALSGVSRSEVPA